MTDIIFARTRHDYYEPRNGTGSYWDYWRMVELAGFATCYTDQIDATDASKCYIFTPRNGEHAAGWPDAKATIIHWNMERHGYDPLPGVAETWCSDKALADLTGAKYVLMGSDARLRTQYGQAADNEPIDCALLAYMTFRRQRIRDMLTEQGMTFAVGGWYEARHALLSRCRAMLVVHQDDNKPWLAPQRMCLAAAYSLPVISETLRDRGDIHQSDILMSDYHYLPKFTRMWLAQDMRLELAHFGEALHNHLCRDWTFRQCVEANV